ncbi:hypothetical protein EON63_08845 [archaeon]|nr:MAG: hypothetical protein EON63_08845 [archaeon]
MNRLHTPSLHPIRENDSKSCGLYFKLSEVCGYMLIYSPYLSQLSLLTRFPPLAPYLHRSRRREM